MNLQKGILYTVIMLVVPFVVIFVFYNKITNTSQAIGYAFLGTLFVNGPLATLAILIEATKSNRSKDKMKFILNWIESTFAIWIVVFIVVVAIRIFLSFK